MRRAFDPHREHFIFAIRIAKSQITEFIEMIINGLPFNTEFLENV